MTSRAFVFSLLCLVMLSVSCNNVARQGKMLQVSAEPKEDILYSFDGRHIVSRLFLKGEDSLVAMTLQEPFFTVIKTGNGSVVESFGRKGRAGGEYLTIPHGVNLRQGGLQFFDIAAKSLLYISLPGGKTKSLPVPYKLEFRPLKIVEVEGILAATGCFAKGEVGYVDSDKAIHFGPDYPYDTGGISGVQIGVSLQSEIIVAPDAPRFVVRSMASDCFEIYEVKNGGIGRVFVNEYNFPPVFERGHLNCNNSRAGYIRCFVDNENIYLMYAEGSYNEASAGGLVSDTIDQYDWEGALVRTVKLPEKVGAFCVRDSILFGTVEYPDRSDIIRYVIE